MDIDNLCAQQDLTEETLLATLRERYEEGQIYTSAGLLLLSLNPYTTVDLHSLAVAEMYRRNVPDLRPHVYSLLDACKASSGAYGPHSVIVSGESGNGKTETVRLMLSYMDVPLIDCVDTVIECMGNARTVNNDNSSRFGRLVRLRGVISIETFLLERSRVTNSSKEFNFHVFYIILANRNEQLVNDYINMNSYTKISQKSENDENTTDSTKYGNIKNAFETLGIPFEPIEKILLGIIYLGSLEIKNGEIKKDEYFYKVLKNLSLDENALESFLLYKTLVIRDETIQKRYSDKESRTFRDSIARLLYEGLFNYVIGKINAFLALKPISETNLNILDIFGFEDMKENGLDQFCINWCNEKIYDEFVHRTFEHQRDILSEEGLVASEVLGSISMENSIIEMIEKKCGIVDLIVEESFINGNSESLGIKLAKMLGLKISAPDILEVQHFAGPIKYCLPDFITKNKENGSLQTLYSGNDTGCGDNGSEEDSSRCEILNCVISESQGQSANVEKSFLKNMNGLFQLLAGTNVKYIKCIKPNNSKSPLVFDNGQVLQQLRANGVLQAIELSKLLYPYMMFIDEFEERYELLPINEMPVVKGCTRYFFNNKTFNILESLRDQRIEESRETIREFGRRYVAQIKLEHALKMEQERLELERIETLRMEQERLELERIEALLEEQRLELARQDSYERSKQELIDEKTDFAHSDLFDESIRKDEAVVRRPRYPEILQKMLMD